VLLLGCCFYGAQAGKEEVEMSIPWGERAAAEGYDFDGDPDDYDYSLCYPDTDQYCPECHEVMGYVVRDGVYGLMCNHCGWPRNKAQEAEGE
jgi:hypothetical protein